MLDRKKRNERKNIKVHTLSLIPNFHLQQKMIYNLKLEKDINEGSTRFTIQGFYA